MPIAVPGSRRRLGVRSPFVALSALAAVLLSSLVAVAVATPSSAALPPVYVVAPNGNDNGPGTEAQPWRSLNGALDRLHPGSILLVRGGEYTGPFFINKQASAAAPILVSAYPNERPVIHAGEWQGLSVQNSSYVSVSGFEIIGRAGTARGRDSGLESVNSHHVRFEGNLIHDFGGGGINLIHSNHVTADFNHIYNTALWGENQMSAISLWQMSNLGGGNNADGYSNYIRNNFVHHNENRVGALSDGNCIILDSNNDVGYTAATMISDNMCWANGGRGIHVFRSSNASVVNNTLIGNLRNVSSPEGELSALYATNVLFRNNLVQPGRGGWSNHVYQAGNVLFDHNAYVDDRAEVMGTNDIVVPGLPLAFGFLPPTDSAVTNGGNPDLAPGIDMIGSPRSGRPDIGAWEVG
jgi:parallel beta-helix repeat protein